MTSSLKHPQLWESEKYLRWHKDHANPRFVMPLPSGGKRSVTVQRFEYESEIDLFERSRLARDAMGRQLWGEKVWNHMLSVKSRSVSRGRVGDSKNETGIRHVIREGKPNVWQAHWYERGLDGKRHQRNKSFSYGTPRSTCRTAKEAKDKAQALRQRKEKDWYISDPQNRRKRKASYREIFQKEIGLAITKKIGEMGRMEKLEKLSLIRDQDTVHLLQKKRYTSVPLETILDIAEQLGVQLELISRPGPAKAE